MNPFLQSVQKEHVPAGSAVLWWLGQMGLLIKTGDQVLCIDYFASGTPDRQVPPPIPAEEMKGVDLFLGTHNHLDHIDHPAWQAWARSCPEARFVFPRIHRQEILEDGISPERCIGMNDGESVRIGGITIHAIAASHEFPDPDPETGLCAFLQYVIEGNGIRIYHAGDTLRYEGMLPKLQAFGHIDAALLPINGRDGKRYREGIIGNMTFQEAADLAGELRPGLVLPGHWDMFAGNPGDPEAFIDYLSVKYEGKVSTLRPRILTPMTIRRNQSAE